MSKKKTKKRQYKSLPSLNNEAVRKQKAFLLFGIAILSIIFIMCVTFLVNEYAIQKQEPLKITFLGSAASNESYNIWFDVDTDYSDGTITFKTDDGIVLSYDNITEQQGTEPITSVDVKDIESKSFNLVLSDIQAFETYYTKLTISIGSDDYETVALFMQIENKTISFITKDAYYKATEVNQ